MQVDPLEHYDIDVFELVNVPSVNCRSLLGKVRLDDRLQRGHIVSIPRNPIVAEQEPLPGHQQQRCG